MFVDAASLISERWNFDNYINGWKGFAGITFTTFFKNTFLVVGISTIGSVLSSAVIASDSPASIFRLDATCGSYA